MQFKNLRRSSRWIYPTKPQRNRPPGPGKSKWWGTACHSRVEFNLNRYVPGTETKTAYYNAYSAGSGNTWTARSLFNWPYSPPGRFPSKLTGRWEVGIAKHHFTQKRPRMTIIRDNKPPISQAFITSITDSANNPISKNSTTNDSKPTIKGYVASSSKKMRG